jgi:hypothetical protein
MKRFPLFLLFTLLNIANGVVDNIGLGRNGGQREQGE